MKTILIADDEPSMRLLVGATLAEGAYRVLEAANGDDAWRQIERERPDLVLLDVMMPGRDGLALTRSIRADPALRCTVVVLLTALAQPGDVDTGLAAGADHYLTKPFSPFDLLDLIERALA